MAYLLLLLFFAHRCFAARAPAFTVVDPALTPYYPNTSVNLGVVPAMVAAAVAAGIDVVLLGGSNGEWPSLSVPERLALLRAWASACKGTPLRLSFHVGHTDVASAAVLAAAAEAEGASAILSIAPGMVFRPPAATALNSTVAALRAIAAAAPRTPFYYYHFPALYNVDVPMADFIPAALAAIPTFKGVKYIDSQYEDILKAGMALGAGSDVDIYPQAGFLLPCLPVGCNGSPLFTWMAGLGRAVAAAFAAGDAAGAAQAQLRVMQAQDIVNAFGGTSAARAVYTHMYGVELGAIRAPQADLTPDQRASLIAQLVAGGFIPAR
jgi:N-acetylneuraminate lyase